VGTSRGVAAGMVDAVPLKVVGSDGGTVGGVAVGHLQTFRCHHFGRNETGHQFMASRYA
jgi:hypothetical protein